MTSRCRAAATPTAPAGTRRRASATAAAPTCGSRRTASASSSRRGLRPRRVRREAAAHMPILDMSPRASKAPIRRVGRRLERSPRRQRDRGLASTPLGPASRRPTAAAAAAATAAAAAAAASCSRRRSTRVDDGTCVQSAADAAWYKCTNGAWVARSSSAGCATRVRLLQLGDAGRRRPAARLRAVRLEQRLVPVQRAGAGSKPVDVAGQSGPIGACSEMDAL